MFSTIMIVPSNLNILIHIHISLRKYAKSIVEIIMSSENKEQIKQLRQKIELNKQIVNSLKEFFGTYLSNFLKQYRNQEQPDEKLNKILQRQDGIYQKFHELMKEC